MQHVYFYFTYRRNFTHVLFKKLSNLRGNKIPSSCTFLYRISIAIEGQADDLKL